MKKAKNGGKFEPHLYVLLDAHEALFQDIEGGSVEHLLLNLGGVRAPGHQEQLLLLACLGGALALVGVLEVKDAVPGNHDGVLPGDHDGDLPGDDAPSNFWNS